MKELIDRIEGAASELDFSGVISVFPDASPVFNKAFGYRDIKNKLPINILSNITNGEDGIRDVFLGFLEGPIVA